VRVRVGVVPAAGACEQHDALSTLDARTIKVARTVLDAGTTRRACMPRWEAAFCSCGRAVAKQQLPRRPSRDITD
jgi:hypothetical protein